ncbi:hypothetical protein DPMN_049907 [Dreissena polymorpha]|uniref:Uncharacterized protein n=1 Tax=Dreissena polymorpha TaxID=45954 RepID=A0A9D4HML0_DREPO|nr:hypothetical protein DPMN_049907 [Dreissena polymorpha]
MASRHHLRLDNHSPGSLKGKENEGGLEKLGAATWMKMLKKDVGEAAEARQEEADGTTGEDDDWF